MASYNPLNTQNSFINTGPTENSGFFSRMLRGLSKFGMNYDIEVARNSVGVAINEDPYAIQGGDSMYDFFSQKAVSHILASKSIPYLDKAYSEKRRILYEYSLKTDISTFVERVADECIVYSDTDFCSVKGLPNEYSQEIKDKYIEYFEKIYNRYGFNNGILAWDMVKEFLIGGYLTYEIVWDDKKQNIIGFQPLGPWTIVPSFDPQMNIALWIQFPEDPSRRRILLDSQLIHISYSNKQDMSETSYVEALIKPYNQLKIIEQTRIMFNIVNATQYQKFTVPVNGLSKVKAEQQIGQLIADYSDEVEWDDTLGTVTINGSKHLPYNKQLWFPSSDQGTPDMELVSPEGTNLNENDMLIWFFNNLKRASRIPFQRFEKENGGGNVFTDASEMTRDEITFTNFVQRLRSNLKELIIKPLKLQMCMEFPELAEDEVFLNSIDIIFNSNQLFEKWKKMNNISKQIEVIQNVLSLEVPVPGNAQERRPYLHPDFVIEKLFGGLLTPEEIEENKQYWIKSDESMNAAGSEGSSDFGSESDNDMGGFENEGGFGEEPEMGGTPQSQPQSQPEQSPPPGPQSQGGSEEMEF